MSKTTDRHYIENLETSVQTYPIEGYKVLFPGGPIECRIGLILRFRITPLVNDNATDVI